MPKIKCHQQLCKYNNKNYCIKEGIYIREDTYCESFKSGHLDKKYYFEFASYENDDKGINCAACNCKHNKDHKCKAVCILIVDNKTICNDYIKKD